MRRLLLLNFPYKKDAEGNVFPVIPLSINFRKKRRGFFALVDSGATVSIFRGEIADALGLKIEAGEEIFLGGVGGRIKGYLHKLEIEVGGKKFRCPIVFSREYLVSFNLLGRKELFKKFRIIFEEKESRLRLE